MSKEDLTQNSSQNAQSTSSLGGNDRKSNKGLLVLLLILGFFVFGIAIYFIYENNYIDSFQPGGLGQNNVNTAEKDYALKQFGSEEEFKEYINDNSDSYYGGFGIGMTSRDLAAPEMMAMDSMESLSVTSSFQKNAEVGYGGGGSSRVSSTNTQVKGIDEPDIVKTDGENIFSSIWIFRNNIKPSLGMRAPFIEDDLILVQEEEDQPEPVDIVESEMMIEPVPSQIRIAEPIIPEPRINEQLTQIIKAFPPEEMKSISGVKEMGPLLVVNDKLIVFGNDGAQAYEVSNPALPVEAWELPYGERTSYHDARLYGDELYLITQTGINQNKPCPFVPLSSMGESYTIPCTDIYYPSSLSDVDVTYTVSKVNTETGEIEDHVSFVGSGFDSVVYMSKDNLFVTHSFTENFFDIFSDFVSVNEDLFSSEFIAKIKALESYDIGIAAKMVEMESLGAEYTNSMTEDDALAFENNVSNRMEEYVSERVREFQSTGITRISRNNLDIEASGYVPGRPLNQFSLDEYNGDLRIATTSEVNNNFGITSDNSINDVYVLGKNLKEKGVAENLGKGERVYSARFIDDKGYVVTFKQVDPFYVLDLSDPKNPEVKGELKIPGYSSYLHPLKEDVILGIGKEGSKVKLSLFDVSNPSDPVEVDKFIMEEYWSDVLNTHHAFLVDPEHEIFFMPGSNGGYIFSYNGDKLNLEKAVTNVGAQRAIYLDDYLYVIGNEAIVVLDENTWDTITEYKY